MKALKKLICLNSALATLLTLFVAASCNDTATGPTDLASNAPVIVSVTNAFSYVMMANNFTSSTSYDLSYTTDSLVYSMVVANFGSGTATFVVTDQGGNAVLRDSITTSKVNAIVQSGKGIPRRCTLAFQNFSGKMTLSLAANQAKH